MVARAHRNCLALRTLVTFDNLGCIQLRLISIGQDDDNATSSYTLWETGDIHTYSSDIQREQGEREKSI